MVVLGLALVVTAWLAARWAVVRADRPSRALVRSHRMSLPVGGSFATGVGFALLPSRGRVSVRTAMAGVIIGITGVVAVLTFSATMRSVEETPERFGWGWDIATNGIPGNADLATVTSHPDVEGVALLTGALVKLPDGQTWTMQLDPVSGDGVGLTVLDGRVPATSGGDRGRSALARATGPAGR